MALSRGVADVAREVVITTWCDVCLNRDQLRTDATGSESIGWGSASRRLDLCANHLEQIGTTLAELVSYGTEPDAETPTPARPSKGRNGGRVQCPACPSSPANRKALADHARRVHNLTLTELERGHPVNQPEGSEGGFLCDRCTFVAAAPQGLGAHRRAAHGIVGNSQTSQYHARKAAESAPALLSA
jgi:hypothetical protein